MEEILDEQFNENEKDETRINRITAVIRYILSIGYTFLVISTIRFYNDPTPTEIGETIGGLIAAILLLIPVRYNVKHANLELKNKYVTPTYKRGYILAFLIFCFLIIGASTFGFVSNVTSKNILGRPNYLHLVFMAILLIGLPSWIAYREIIYYKRATRLKRLKNE